MRLQISIFTIFIAVWLVTGCEGTPYSANNRQAGVYDYYVIALNWQPSLCELRPSLRACDGQHKGRFDANNLALHGLWPSALSDTNYAYGYCGVEDPLIAIDKKGNWCDLPMLALEDSTRDRLSQFMPGARACLHRHEWFKHGTCSGLTEEAYFRVSNRIVEIFSTSRFNALVANHAGRTIERDRLLQAFEEDFGANSRRNLHLRCKAIDEQPTLAEVFVYLHKDLAGIERSSLPFPDLSLPSRDTCPNLIKVDAVGLNMR